MQAPEDFRAAKTNAVNAFANFWTAGGTDLRDENRNLAGGILLMDKYCDHYQQAFSWYDPKYVEVEQKYPMPNGTFLVFVIDRIQINAGVVILTDTKTTSKAISDWFWNAFENSFQLSAYHYICESVFGRCDGICVDAIRVPYAGPNSFARQVWTLTAQQKEDFRLTYDNITARIIDAGKDPRKFPCHPTGCTAYGGCPFLPLCKYGLNYPGMNDEFVKERDE